MFLGIVEKTDGSQKLVVTGGYFSAIYYSSTEELDLDTLQWTAGKDLPDALDYGSSVQYKDSFLAVGGTNGAATDHIYEYDSDTGDWITRIEKMVSARYLFAAFLVPEEVANCG